MKRDSNLITISFVDIIQYPYYAYFRGENENKKSSKTNY